MDSKVKEVYGSYESLAEQMAETVPDGYLIDAADRIDIYRLVDRKGWWDIISD